MGKIFVVGVGPGSKEFLTTAAKNAIEEAAVLMGGKKALEMFPNKKPKKIIDKDLDGVLKFIKGHEGKNIAILTSGDPGFYSILDFIMRNFSREEVEVIPGISSMQLCFSKIKDSWHDSKIISFHGRSMKSLLQEIENKKLVLLTDNSSSPDRIAAYLLKNNIKGRRVVVCDSLSQTSERIIESDLEGIAKEKFSGNCVMVIYNEVGV